MELVQIDGIDVNSSHSDFSILKKTGLTLLSAGIFFLVLGLTRLGAMYNLIMLVLSVGFIVAGGMIYITAISNSNPAGIKNNGIMFRSLTSRGVVAWILAIILTLFYITLYWFPSFLENWIRLVDPLAYLIMGQPADQWFLYGTLYTIAVLMMGLYMIFYKYRYNRYHQVRTLSIMFFQFGFAYFLPYVLKGFNQPDFYFSYFWPLNYNYLFPDTVDYLLAHPGGLGVFMVFWGAMMSFVAVPILTFFFGKRWYCSWVCGCGGLANTAGDPFRQLSDKSIGAWKLERWTIHLTLIFAVITTILVWINSISAGQIFGQISQTISSSYGFFIGAIFSGVIGVGFYPLLGNRIWCRFGCPLAAILGIIQKYFSRFRITTNGSQCISCGNCSTYCEMGIDVRWYAQREQNIVRASCVGCGVCAAVCPRGVLKLENGPVDGRFNLSESR